jgi:DNA helicase-2/ATP-dependent DNA helicase PcrA
MSTLHDGLNKEQLQAVTHGAGPLMIVAGAGTGKTTVITKRIAWLIESGLAKQEEILALTFTEKAATEMEERVDQLLPIGYLDLWIATFHGFCERVLRTYGIDIGLANSFKLFTTVDTWMLVRKNLALFNFDYFKPQGNPTKFIETILTHYSRAKDEGVTPEMYQASVAKLELNAASTEEEELELKKMRELANGYAVYQQLLADNSSLDFGDLILQTLTLFRTRPNILKKYQAQFKYIVVDEFQDTNSAQYQLIKLLGGSARNITVVGDDDQAIYRFRGAALANILNFRTDFPDTARVVLTHNYRSGKVILDHAYNLIQNNNPHRLEASESLNKQLIAANGTEGFVQHLHLPTLTDEIAQTAEIILALHASGCAWNDIAILVRGNDAADPFILEFERAGIPYRFMALSGLYTKPIILDALAYLRVVDQPHDSPSLYRILSHPRLGLTEKDLVELSYHARKSGSTLFQALSSCQFLPQITLESKETTLAIIKYLEDLRSHAKRLPVTELFVEVLKITGLLADTARLGERQQREEYQLMQSFLERLRRFAAGSADKSVHAFLEEFTHERAAGESGALPHDIEEGPDVVNIMTVHGAKGLEFRFVFVVNLVEQRFPSQARGASLSFPLGLVNEDWSSDEHQREERRLFYVAMTRAKEGLYLLSADDYGGVRYKKPSRYLVELGFIDPSQIKTSKKDSVDTLANSTTTIDNSPIAYQTPKKLSFTQIAAFDKCPLQYKFAHILHVPVFGRYQMSYGKSMHNTLQLFMEAYSSIPLVPLLKIFDEQWIDEWYENDEQREQYRSDGKKSLATFYKQVITNKPKPIFLERGFTLKILDVTVKGRIDRIDEIENGWEIIDYKTGGAKTISNISWEDKRQLVLYAMAVAQCFTEAPVNIKLTYYYLENNSTVSFQATAKDQAKLIDNITEFMSLIRVSDFAPTPNKFTCSSCDFKDICNFNAS